MANFTGASAGRGRHSGALARAEFRHRIFILICVSALSAGAGLFVVEISPGTDELLILCIAAAAIFPVAVRAAHGRFDILEPTVPTAVGVLLLFVARPLYEQATTGHHTYVQINVDAVWHTTLVACLLGVAGFQAGYLMPIGRDFGRRLVPKAPPKGDVIITLAGILTLIAFVGLLARAYVSGSIGNLVANRSEGTYHGAFTATATTLATLAIPALLLLWTVRDELRRAARMLSPFAIGTYLLLAIPGGNRRYLLMLLSTALVFYYLRRRRRPHLVRGAIVLFALIVFVINPTTQARKGGESYATAIAHSASQPLDAPTALLRSQDTSIIDSFGVLIMDVGNGKPIPYQDGKSTLTETILQPLPHVLVPWRPQTIRDQVILERFDNSAGSCSTLCPAFPSIGTFYSDWGLPVIPVGCFIVGCVARWWWRLLGRNSTDPVIQAAYASTYFLWFYFWWSSLGFIFIQFLVFVIPLVVSRRLGARVTKSAPSGPQMGEQSYGTPV